MGRLDKMKEFYNSLSVEHLDIAYFADEDHESFQDLFDAIDEGDGFNVEIIYYSTAMQYLSENDNSLKQSLELAEEMGYTPSSLSSEILASILASQNVREEFEELRDEIETFLSDLAYDEDSDE